MPKGKIVTNKEKLLIWEKRLLLVAFVCGIIAALLFLISFSTEFWVWVEFPTSQARNDSHRSVDEQAYYKTGHYHGLWKICRQEFRNLSVGTPENEHSLYCRSMYFTLPSHVKEEYIDVETSILDYRRSTVSVGFISLILSLIANCFVYFSLGQLRYMFKRLSGCLALMTGASSWVTLEVFKRSVYFEENHMKYNFTSDAIITFGWSYNLVWVVLILYLFDGVVMLACSRKRKGKKARSVKEARENEPVYLGRI